MLFALVSKSFHQRYDLTSNLVSIQYEYSTRNRKLSPSMYPVAVDEPFVVELCTNLTRKNPFLQNLRTRDANFHDVELA